MGICFWSAQLRPIAKVTQAWIHVFFYLERFIFSKRLQAGLSQSNCRIARVCVKAANKTKEMWRLAAKQVQGN